MNLTFIDKLPTPLIQGLTNCLTTQDKARFETTCTTYAKLSGYSDSYKAEIREITTQKTRVQGDLGRLERLENFQNAYERALKASKDTWLGWLVNKLEGKTGILGKIHQLFQKLFISYKCETHLQREIKTNLLENSQIFQKSQLTAAYVELTKLQSRESALHAERCLMDVCGGQENFEKIPFTALKKIDAEQMSAKMLTPLVRGFDEHNHPFIIYTSIETVPLHESDLTGIRVPCFMVYDGATIKNYKMRNIQEIPLVVGDPAYRGLQTSMIRNIEKNFSGK